MWGSLPTFFYSWRLPRHGVNETLEAVINAELAGAGFDLVELRTAGSGTQRLFEIRIERRDGVGVTVDDCARMSRLLEARLDAGGLVPEHYVLQVSSPGDRLLRSPAEWRRFVGQWVSVLAPEHGGRFEARVFAVEGDDAVAVVTLEQDGRRRDVPLAKVKEARLAFRI